MKILRKILGLLPILAIGFTLLLAFITFCLGLGKVVMVYHTDCLSGNSCVNTWDALPAYSLEYYAPEDLAIGNVCSVIGFLLLCASLVFSILNLPKKTAKGPWLLIAGIMTFVAQIFLVIRPALLVNIRTTDTGNVWEGFNWATFAFSTLLWFNCIILFILNKTLFKKVINE